MEIAISEWQNLFNLQTEKDIKNNTSRLIFLRSFYTTFNTKSIFPTLNRHELVDCNFQQYRENAVVGVLFFCHSIGFEYQWLKSFMSEIWYLESLQLEFSEGFTLSTVSETTVISQAFVSFRSSSQNIIRLSIRTYCF